MRTTTLAVALGMAIAIGVLPATAAADTIVVPDDQPSIQAAVDVAQNGDTIRVRRGDYAENVDVDDFTGLTIRFDSGAVLRPAQIGTPLDVDGCTDVTLRGVRVEGTTNDGILLNACQGCTLSRCSVVDAGIGIYIEDSPDTRVDRCSVFSIDRDGILIDDGSDGSVVTRCDAEQTGRDGIHIDADDVLVERCVVTDAMNFGIAVDADTRIVGVRIIRCRVTGGGDDGIVVNGTGTFVDKCVVIDSGEHSIDVESEAVDCVVQRCKTVRGLGGLDMEGSGNTAQKNKHLKPTETAVFVDGPDQVLLKIKVTKPGQVGIQIQASAVRCEIERCGIKKAATFAIVLLGTGNTLTRNKSVKSGAGGLDDRSGGGNTLTGNQLK